MPEEPLTYTGYETIDMLKISSLSAFNQLMGDLSTGAIHIKDVQPQRNLFSSLSSLDYRNDPILKYEMREAQITKSDLNKSVYSFAGYEELIPDENLAGLLNARGEIQISDKVYKIAKSGTYCIDENKLNEFNDSFTLFEEMEGPPLDEGLYQLYDGVLRFDTFGEEDYECFYAEDYYVEDDADTKIITSLKNLDYKKYPRYCSDAKTFIGKILQSLFGRNKAFDYKFTNNRRFSSKFYYYDYIFWSSIGVSTKMQKKSFLLWKEEKAEEIFTGWGEIITETELKGNVLEYPTKLRAATITTTGKNNYTGKGEVVAYVFGLELTDQAIMQAIGKGLQSLLTLIKNKTGASVASADKLVVVAPSKYYTIHLPGGKSEYNTSSSNNVFYKELSLGITLDLLNLPSDWVPWVASIAKTTYSLPNTRLHSGEVRAAVRYDGKIGAMSIYKPASK